ncbi:MAG: tRNA adenosine(34) deaminase TadA [Chloroflexota bacterium]
MDQHQVDVYFMRLALEEAQKAAALEEVPVGAVAVYNGEVVGRGHNRKESKSDPTAHAEMFALREAAQVLENWRLLDVTLYCTLEPCPMCAGAMIQSRLPRLVYGAADTKFGADGSIVSILKPMPEGERQFNHKIEVTRGVLAEESLQLLQSFFQALRSRK